MNSNVSQRPVRDLCQEDKRKLHQEVNQVVHQRFLISTAALTFFGGLSALALHPQSAPNRWLYSSLLIALLFFLYLQAHFLRSLHRTFSAYLRLTGASVWEHDWKTYRAHGYFGYAKTQTVLFLCMIGIASSTPSALAYWEVGGPLHVARDVCGPLILGAPALLLVFGMGFLDWFSNESAIEHKWSRVLKSEPPARQS